MAQHHTYQDIENGDSVTIETAQGQYLTGWAVMKGPCGWVLNCGGRYGTPAICDQHNFFQLRKGIARRRRGLRCLR